MLLSSPAARSALAQTLLLGTLLLLAGCAAPLVPPWSGDLRRPRSFDLQHVEVALELHHRAGFVRGEAALTLAALDRPLSLVELDAVELALTRAWDATGRELHATIAPETIRVALAEPLAPGASTVIHLAWEASPRRGLYFEGPSRSDPTRPWHVWSQGQAHEARHWMPAWDQPTDRATFRLALTVDDELATLCAGTLESSQPLPASGRRRDTWFLDLSHPTYLVTLVAGELALGHVDGDPALPVLARERDLPAALAAVRHTPAMLDSFARLTGRPYPFPKYAQVFIDNFTAGGMENISATTMYDEGLHVEADEPQVDITGLVAHELAHQWFGDLITCHGWGEVWLNEGFADWCDAMFTGELLGQAELELCFLDLQRQGCEAEDANSRPIVFPAYAHPDEMFDGHSYQGAAARIRLLEDLLTVEVFRRALAVYVERHADSLVTTADFQAVMEEVSGRDLDGFFDAWFHGAGYPVIEARLSGDGSRLRLSQVQGERGGPAWFPLGLQVTFARGGAELRADLSFDAGPVTEVAVPPGAGAVDWLRLDAQAVVPGQLVLFQPEEAWAHQLRGADDAVTRVLAARWLAGHAWLRGTALPAGSGAEPGAEPGAERGDDLGAEARAALLAAAADEPFWAVREAVAEALGRVDDPACRQALVELTQDGDPRVVAAALDSLEPPLSGDEARVVRAAVRDPNGAVATAAARLLVDDGHPDAAGLILDLLAAESGGAGRVRLARDLVKLLPRLDHPEVTPVLLATAAHHPERWVRAAAVAALPELGGAHPADEVVFQRLCAALHDEAYGVRAAAARALARDGLTPREELQLRARFELEPDPTVRDALSGALD